MTTVPVALSVESRDDHGVERYRARLFGIAFRMLGDVQEAEDLVQETMLRWHQADRGDIRVPEAWLVTVITRLAIDRARSVAAERARYPGPWLPEPMDVARFDADYQAELASDLDMAFLVLVEQLAPEERAAFLLREVFGTEYAEIAAVLGKSQAAVRQIVHRARARVRGERPRRAAAPDTKARLLGRFIAALRAGDKDALLAVLAEDTTWASDGGGKAKAARRVVRGADRVARLALGIARKLRPAIVHRLTWLNGEPAMVQYRHGRLHAATFCDVDGDRIVAMYWVINPEKLTRVA
jgi:RNA polymerase sigma-70 factor (ECF subfamily)